jgi:hypothetical protein
MITSLLFYIIGFFLSLIVWLLNTIKFIIPIEITNGIAYFAGYLVYVRGFIDVDTLVTALGTYLTFLAFYYTIKIGLWLFGHMPWVGKHSEMPKINREIIETNTGGRSNVKWIERTKF